MCSQDDFKFKVLGYSASKAEFPSTEKRLILYKQFYILMIKKLYLL